MPRRMGLRIALRRREGEEEGFFFGKKKQKTFLGWGRGVCVAGAQIHKVFLLLFVHKKKDLLRLSVAVSEPEMFGLAWNHHNDYYRN